MAQTKRTGLFERSLADSNLSIQRREWWLSGSAMVIMLLLTFGIVSYAVPGLHLSEDLRYSLPTEGTLRGLVGSVLLFDLYAISQQVQIFRMRKRLSNREELFRVISENAADMIAVVDAAGNRIYTSPSYEQILGYPPEDLMKTSGLEEVHPDDRESVSRAAAEALKTHVGQRLEYRMRHKNGTWRLVESTASAVLNERGEVTKLIIVNRDVTERRQLERQLRQAQKMEAIGRLSGGIAHDFNNLLGVIIGYTEILEENAGSDETLRNSAAQILRAGHQAACLTRQLLAFSRQQVLEAKTLDINAVVRDTEKMLCRLIGADICIKTQLQPEANPVRVDQTQLEQAILNMAVNARDAMPEGGNLIIETKNFEITRELAEQYSYPVTPGNYVLLSVKDTGTGMDNETQARIFEPFFTTKEKGKGTGLGLAMVYGFVKQSGGYIDVWSKKGVGTTLNIYLPKTTETLQEETNSSEKISSSQGQETILLVEDENSLRLLTKRILESLGYKVIDAADGESAIRMSEEFRGRIDLLLADIIMPGVNGRAVAEVVIKQRPNMRVLFMSGYTGQTIHARDVLEQGSFFLPKPFSRKALAEKVKEALHPIPASHSV
jgi:PAS domain S-box-containing protein